MPHPLPPADTSAAAIAVKRRKRRRADQTTPAREGELLRVAASMFREHGYDATSISDIALAFGITKASLYHYIDSKEDLLYRICRAAHDDALPVIEDVESDDAPPLERLERFLRATVTSNARHVVNIAVYYHDFNRLTGERKSSILRERRRYHDLLVRLVDEGKRAGAIGTGVPTQVICANLLAQVIWIYTWYREDEGLPPEELGAAIARLALTGLPRRTPPA
jgi:TetR/AcrR family transcriptional regulator, cholesterol catabolism regulator